MKRQDEKNRLTKRANLQRVLHELLRVRFAHGCGRVLAQHGQRDVRGKPVNTHVSS